MQPLIHIGYQKTGTTWLQNFLLNNKEAGFETPFLKGYKTPNSLASLLVYPNALDFNVSEVKRIVAPALQSAAARGLIPIITSERFSGDPHSGGYDSKEVANRLAFVFPGAKVLIVIREQKSMILSVYQQYIRAGGRAPIKYYIFPTERGKLRIPLFNFDFFKYHRLVACYQTLFGEGNVRVLAYEMFRDRPEEFISEIIRFAGGKMPAHLPYGRKSNEAPLSLFGSMIKRRLNFISGIDTVNPHTLIRSANADHKVLHLAEALDRACPKALKARMKRSVERFIKEAVGDRYKESNKKTSELIGCDLAQYGYEM